MIFFSEATSSGKYRVVFDLLVDEHGKVIAKKPLAERRERLEKFADTHLNDRLRLSPVTLALNQAKRWFRERGGSLDGAYEPGERTGGFLKIKHRRTADCVVGGFRYATKGNHVGSLLLGLYGGDGLPHHVGFTSSIQAKDRTEVTGKLENLIEPPGFTGPLRTARTAGAKRAARPSGSRWRPGWLSRSSTTTSPAGGSGMGRSSFDGADKTPKDCTMRQVEQEAGSPLDLLK